MQINSRVSWVGKTPQRSTNGMHDTFMQYSDLDVRKLTKSNMYLGTWSIRGKHVNSDEGQLM